MKKSKGHNLERSRKGFTIVELIVVMVVIGVLAAITVVSYSNVSQRARSAAQSSDLSNASRKLSVFQATYDSFPQTIDCSQPDSATNLCIKSSSGTTYNYTYSGNSKFCIDTTVNSTPYRIVKDGSIEPGICLDYGKVLHLDAGNAASYSGSGSTWTDLSGNANNATLIDSPVYTAGGGGYFTFDGVNDRANIDLDSSLVLNDDNHTLSFWFNLSAAPTNTYGHVIHRFLGNPNRGYFMCIRVGGSVQFNEGYLNNEGVYSNLSNISPSTYVDSNWHLAVATVDVTEKRSRLYVDGAQVHTSVYTGNLLNYDTDLLISGYNTSTRFLGGLGEIRIYNRSMTADEVSHFYDTTKARFGL